MSYNNIASHHSMIFDEHRNALYGDAIRKCVDSESIVLDLGAGMGLHGFMAAKAGARKVYLVEPADVLDVAAMAGQSNELAANVQYIKKIIEETQIPDPIDIIISVFTGNFLLTEDLLPSLIYARNKFLAPAGRLIPDRAKMEVVPVMSPEFYDKHINSWLSPVQGLDYSLVRKFIVNKLFYCNSETFKGDFLAEPSEILDIDLMTVEKAECESKTSVSITTDGICHGWLGWFQTRLGDAWLSTSPKEKTTHWNQAFLPLDPPIPVQAGQIMNFDLKRLEFGEWTWTVTIDNVRQRHSTFLSRPLTTMAMEKKIDTHKAVLNDRGKMVLSVLQKLDGNISTEEIALSLVELHPDVFPGYSQAKQFVIDLIENYT